MKDELLKALQGSRAVILAKLDSLSTPSADFYRVR